MSPASTRHEARERALSLLYEAEIKGMAVDDVLAELPLQPDRFVIELISGVESRGDRIDKLIDEASVDWAIDRMPALDRNVLRIAVYELLENKDTPVAAVISEAVELAKAFSTEESGKFVNGVLGALESRCRN